MLLETYKTLFISEREAGKENFRVAGPESVPITLRLRSDSN